MMRPVPLGLIVALLAIGADQVTKWWILASVMDPPRVINVTHNCFRDSEPIFDP